MLQNSVILIRLDDKYCTYFCEDIVPTSDFHAVINFKVFDVIIDITRILESNKSSHRRCSIKKDVLKDFAKLTGKHLCWSLFLIKFQT